MVPLKYFIATLIAITSVGANAADVPRPATGKQPVSPVLAPASWTGFYAGAHGAFGIRGRSEFKTSAASIVSVDDLNKIAFGGQKGFGGGAQAGYDHQINAIVVGLAADFNLSAKGKTYVIDPTINGKLELKTPFEATLRARAGYAVTPDVLAYVTAGAATTRHAFRYSDTDPTMIKQSKVHFGYVVGAGAEYRISKAISAFAEYRASMFQSVTYTTINAAKAAYRTNEVRAGLNYRF